VAKKAKQHYSTDDVGVNMIGQSQFLAYGLGFLLYYYVVVHQRLGGLRVSLLFAALFNGLGSLFRLSTNITLMIFGTSLSGIAIPFFLGMPASLAATWFEPSHRSIATAFAAMTNQLGMVLGFLVPSSMMSGDTDAGFAWLNGGTAVMTAISFSLVFFLFEETPSHVAEESAPSWEQFTLALKNPSFALISLLFGTSNSIYWALALVLNESLSKQFSLATIGTFGTVLMGMGVLGMTGSGYLLHYLRQCNEHYTYKRHISILLVLCCITLALFAIVVHTQGASKAAVLVLCGCTGFLLPATTPPLLEVQVANVSEYTMGTILFFWAQVGSLVLMLVCNALTTHMGVLYYVFLACYLIITLLYVFMDESKYGIQESDTPRDQSTAPLLKHS